MALAFVEALIMEDAHKAQAIAPATTEADLDDTFFTASKCLRRDRESLRRHHPRCREGPPMATDPRGDSFTAAASPSWRSPRWCLYKRSWCAVTTTRTARRWPPTA